MQSYFIWNGIDSRAMGVITRRHAPLIRPEERVEHVQIPGSSGDLTETEGENIYNSYIQTISFSVTDGSRVRDVFRWLRGSGTVTFSSQPGLQQAARVVGAVTLEKHSRNLDWWEGEVQFYCQPLKEKLQEETVTVTSSGTSVRNAGDVIAKPHIVATANATSMTIAAGGKLLEITGLTSGTKYTIDSDIMEIGLAEGVGLWTANSIGEFPVLKPGSNTITGSGWSKLEIEKRERFL